MKLSLLRFANLPESTISALYIDDLFACFGLEDQAQNVKVPGETRIPAGTYQISLRTEGTMTLKYKSKFPEHRGMLWLRAVPNFEWIYLHVGVKETQTDGCILLGDVAMANGELAQSAVAYRRIYALVSNAILAGEPVEISVEDRA